MKILLGIIIGFVVAILFLGYLRPEEETAKQPQASTPMQTPKVQTKSDTTASESADIDSENDSAKARAREGARIKAIVQSNAVARPWMTAPGAIVCPDLQTVQLLQHLYADQWEVTARNSITSGQSTLLEGQPQPVDPSLYGCSLLSSGTPVQASDPGELLRGVAALVKATLPDGTTVQGITSLGMLDKR